MRSLEASRQRWEIVFANDSLRLDLRQAVKSLDSRPHPCEDGLRSVCWKAFLLYGPVSQASWPQKLSDSRSAYASLRDHFLRYIDHPDDLQSTVDPLADDGSSPWNQVRRDESNREEIFQDVARCMQDNDFFREPSTQKLLLDILFIYSKLHPDIGYRQGMHELLAPILWVMHCDALESNDALGREEGDLFMAEVLNQTYVEPDTFTLFCAVMQTAKSFYELGDSNAPIVERSQFIQDECLGSVDPELAIHLKVIEILPQIYLLRWMRLLFGREFGLKDTLIVWDLLFSENLGASLVDMTCVAMLLRIRWQLIDADYSTALQLLLRYPAPLQPDGPATLIEDAIFLERSRNQEAGADLIFRRSGRRPRSMTADRDSPSRRPPALQLNQRRQDQTLTPSMRSAISPGLNTARFLSPQKGLESLFQEVSGNLQKKTEGWNVGKTLREAVRRNMSNLQSSENSPRSSLEGTAATSAESVLPIEVEQLRRKVMSFERRNQALAKMMGEALEDLRGLRQSVEFKEGNPTEESLNITLAKLQFVQVYLADSDIPIPSSKPQKHTTRVSAASETSTLGQSGSQSQSSASEHDQSKPLPDPKTLPVPTKREITSPRTLLVPDQDRVKGRSEPTKPLFSAPQPRPGLAQSPLSWMLGDGHHRSDFVTSASPPPEERRDSIPKARPKRLFADDVEADKVKDGDSEDDGFTMNSLRGGRT